MNYETKALFQILRALSQGLTRRLEVTWNPASPESPGEPASPPSITITSKGEFETVHLTGLSDRFVWGPREILRAIGFNPLVRAYQPPPVDKPFTLHLTRDGEGFHAEDFTLEDLK